MTELLIKRFVKNHEQTSSGVVRERYGVLSGAVGIICNAFLSAFKIAVGTLFNNLAIVADGVNNLSDAINSIITLIGFKIAAKPADRSHPFGHARYEYISGLTVAIVILILGINLVKSSFDKIITPGEITFSYLSVAVLVLSILLKLWMSRFYRHIARRIDSMAIYANASDSVNDIVATAGILISVIIGRIFGLQLDGYISMAVSLFIVWSGAKLIGVALSPIIGEAPQKDITRYIKDTIRGYPCVKDVHDLIIHSYGHGKTYATVHVEVSSNEDFLQIHDAIDAIERDFMNNDGINLTVHIDPIGAELGTRVIP